MSQMDGVTKTIGPDTYKVNMLDPMAAGDLLIDLTAVFGPALGAMGASVLKSKNSKEAFKQLLDGVGTDGQNLLGENLERALTELIDRLEKTKQREIISLLSDATSVQKGDKWPQLKSVFAVHFRGRIKAMYAWLAFAVRAQYSDFF